MTEVVKVHSFVRHLPVRRILYASLLKRSWVNLYKPLVHPLEGYSHKWRQRPLAWRKLYGALAIVPSLARVPSLDLLTQAGATGALNAVGLVPGAVSFQSSSVGVGLVIPGSQSPIVGKLVALGTSVSFTISTGSGSGVATSSPVSFEIVDNQNGSMTLYWPAFPGGLAQSYNVYVNGVLNQNVTGEIATVSGLQKTTYNPSAVAAPTGSQRPQNMPPTGVVTPSGTYVFNIAAVINGVEVASTIDYTVTVSPTSIALITSMKRLWPFPNTGLD